MVFQCSVRSLLSWVFFNEMFDGFNKRLEVEERAADDMVTGIDQRQKQKIMEKKIKMWRAFLALPLLSTLSSTMNWRERKIAMVRGAHGRDPFS